MKTIYESLKNSGGATLNVTLYSNAYSLKLMNMDKGYQVSVEDLVAIPLKFFRVNVDDLMISEMLKLIIELKASKKDIRDYNGEVCVGLWIDNGLLYIDISQYVGDLSVALQLGYKNNQKAIFDWSTKQSIYLDEYNIGS